MYQGNNSNGAADTHASNGSGVIRIGRKGVKKFAFGEDGTPFEIDVVVAFQAWVSIDDQFRERSEDRSVLVADMAMYHQAAREFAAGLTGAPVTDDADRLAVNAPISTAEALDFIARLREQYDEVAAFFHPRSREERDSPGTSGVELQFSAEDN